MDDEEENTEKESFYVIENQSHILLNSGWILIRIILKECCAAMINGELKCYIHTYINT